MRLRLANSAIPRTWRSWSSPISRRLLLWSLSQGSAARRIYGDDDVGHLWDLRHQRQHCFTRHLDYRVSRTVRIGIDQAPPFRKAISPMNCVGPSVEENGVRRCRDDHLDFHPSSTLNEVIHRLAQARQKGAPLDRSRPGPRCAMLRRELRPAGLRCIWRKSPPIVSMFRLSSVRVDQYRPCASIQTLAFRPTEAIGFLLRAPGPNGLPSHGRK